MSAEVDAIGSRITEIREEKNKLDEEERGLWQRFFEICDDLAGEGESFKHVIPDIAQTIAREMHTSTPQLLIEAFKEELTDEQWKSITRQERVFDMAKLERAVEKGTVPSDLVNQHTQYKPPVPHKKLRAATKKELQAVS